MFWPSSPCSRKNICLLSSMFPAIAGTGFKSFLPPTVMWCLVQSTAFVSADEGGVARHASSVIGTAHSSRNCPTQMSSMQPPTLGKSSLTLMPLLPYFLN